MEKILKKKIKDFLQLIGFKLIRRPSTYTLNLYNKINT